MSSVVVTSPEELAAIVKQAVREELAAASPAATDMISPVEVRDHYGVSLATQTQWRKDGLIDFVQVGRVVRYRVGDLMRFFDRHGTPVNRRGAKKNNPKLMIR